MLGGSYILEENETLNGSLIVLGGTAALSENSTVTDDVFIMGGTLTAAGTIQGDVAAIGGLVSLESTAQVNGDINALSASLKRAEGSQVDGEVNTDIAGPFTIDIPGNLKIPGLEGLPPISIPRESGSPVAGFHFNPIWDVFWWLIRSFIWAVMAVLVGLFAPKAISRAGEAAISSPAATAGLGCLTILVFPMILVLLAITICGIPFSLIGAFGLWFAWVFGVIVLGTETGKRIANLFKGDWAVPVSAGVGTFILTLVMNGLGLLVPCVGWIVPMILGSIGLGAAVLTRLGTRSYPNEFGTGGTLHHSEAEPSEWSPIISPSESSKPSDGDVKDETN